MKIRMLCHYPSRQCLMILLLLLTFRFLATNPMENFFQAFIGVAGKETNGLVRSSKVAIEVSHVAIEDEFRQRRFLEALQEHASPDKLIYLVSIDSGFKELALNLYYSSFRKLDIRNYLFVASDSRVCNTLRDHNALCQEYMYDEEADKASIYNTIAFARKTHLKTKIILEALKLGLKVVITDADIVFFKDPTQNFTCSSCDIEMSSDVVEGNSGFYLARPTNSSIDLHERAWQRGLENPAISNQKTIDPLMEDLVQKKAIRAKNLDPNIFVNGKVFFEESGRMFKGDSPCKECVILHNNWIVSSAAKIYRFKEMGFWASDYKQYYSSHQNKYLAFDLPVDFGAGSTKAEELKALKAAFVLGHLLNRIVILPKFHCYGCSFSKVCESIREGTYKCTMATFYRIEMVDEHFKDSYRENSFLSHELVPDSVRSSMSPTFFIQSEKYKDVLHDFPRNVTILTPLNNVTGPTRDEILRWFAHGDISMFSVLKFHSLYTPLNLSDMDSFMEIVDSSFKAANLRQFYVNDTVK